jgi:hypothetical protein
MHWFLLGLTFGLLVGIPGTMGILIGAGEEEDNSTWG